MCTPTTYVGLTYVLHSPHICATETQQLVLSSILGSCDMKLLSKANFHVKAEVPLWVYIKNMIYTHTYTHKKLNSIRIDKNSAEHLGMVHFFILPIRANSGSHIWPPDSPEIPESWRMSPHQSEYRRPPLGPWMNPLLVRNTNTILITNESFHNCVD